MAIEFNSFVGFCELTIKYRDHAPYPHHATTYTIRIGKNGSIYFFVGATEVPQLPTNESSVNLGMCLAEHRDAILEFMNAKDTVEAVNTYWKVKTAITGQTPKGPVKIG